MLSKLSHSIATALMGFSSALRSEQNLRFHFAIAAVVIATGFTLGLAAWEWVAVVLCIGLVISAECMNTALERLADRVSLDIHPLIKQAKDCASAAVLTLAITTAVVGGIVFVPKLRDAIGW